MSSQESFAFFGRIHPERMGLRLQGMQLNHRSELGNADLEIFIHESQVLVDVKTPEPPQNIHTLRNAVRDGVASLTDPMSFLLGKHIDVEIIAVITPDGRKKVFGVEYEYISERFDDEEIEDWFQKVLHTYTTDSSPYVQRCMTDFKLAMEHPEDTGFYCFRAVESLRQYFKEIESDDSTSWERLREAIGVERETIEEDLQSYSKARRHGEPFTITAEERKLVLETTWNIIREFLNYADDELEQTMTVNNGDES